MEEFPTNTVEQGDDLYVSAERLKKEHQNFNELVVSIGNFIREHSRTIPNRKEAKSIIESRLTSPVVAFKTGLISCGTIASISAEMLRHLGYEVRLIHGESRESVDHAWISVYDPEQDIWKEFDLTLSDGIIPETHKKKLEIDSFEEIRDQLVKDNETLHERRKKRKG